MAAGKNKTVYARAQDADAWEYAEALADSTGESISSLIVDGLRLLQAQAERKATPPKRVSLTLREMARELEAIADTIAEMEPEAA